MKKIFLSVYFVLGMAAYANAADFNYTGAQAQAINEPYDWFRGPGTFVGGPGNDDIYGAAQQFTLDNATNFTDLNVSATILSSTPGTTTVNFDINGNQFPNNPLQQIPDPNTLIFQSPTVSYTETLQQSLDGISQKVNNQVPFNVDLQPGTYWLVESASNGAGVNFDSITYDPAQSSIGTAVAPEPPSVFLMLLGLTGALIFKRKFQFVL